MPGGQGMVLTEMWIFSLANTTATWESSALGSPTVASAAFPLPGTTAPQFHMPPLVGPSLSQETILFIFLYKYNNSTIYFIYIYTLLLLLLPFPVDDQTKGTTWCSDYYPSGAVISVGSDLEWYKFINTDTIQPLGYSLGCGLAFFRRSSPSPSCNQQTCVHGKCDSDGKCICQPGWYGAPCDRIIPPKGFSLLALSLSLSLCVCVCVCVSVSQSRLDPTVTDAKAYG